MKHLANETVKLGEQLRKFRAATADFDVYETPRELRARQRQAMTRAQQQNTTNPQPITRKRCQLNLNTPKFHALGHYVAIIAQNGTTDSFSTQTTELQHRKIKVQWSRTNKDNAIPQMTRIGDVEDALDKIQERLDKQASNSSTDSNQTSQDDSAEPYTIGRTDRTDNAINIPLWVRSHGSNPVMKFFIPSLKQHLLSRITGDPGSPEIGKVTFQTDRMFSHATLGIHYTSYDVRREHDTVNPKSSSRFVLLPSSASDDPNAHPFLYARVLGIYHANVRYCGRPPKRMDFLWVRWLDYDKNEPGGWGSERLDRVSYAPCRNDEELLDGFGFIDPRNVIRAVHLIPDFNCGTSGSIFAADPTLVAPDNTEHDWNYHYVNRDIGHDEEEYVGPQGSEADEDSLEDTFDISNTEEADDFMSGEEDFIDDLYDL
ncbi:unnamed protein product [Rhizoctonia solani]|uniref:Uncharacterized protein n=1 Tax=Rhizoctonia solani TaxID=456999 RepID=A0A8H3C5Q1_9AGAM|nr:unnamed protein product [Rhizoctonia solani]